jgi:transposase
MAWSPFQRANAGIIGVEQPGDYANPIPTTSATGPAREIIRLKFSAGVPTREIWRRLGLAPSTVRETLNRLASAGLSWPLREGISDAELETALYANRRSKRGHRRHAEPDWPAVHRELKRKHVTLLIVWDEYIAANPGGYSYSRFCELYRGFEAKLSVTMRQTHVAGERLFVDYAGDGVPVVVDRHTGELRKAQVFVAVLGASSFTFAFASWTQTLPDWIDAHVRALKAIGGVPQLIVPDNTKTAVIKACVYDPQVNRTYAEMAAHYGTAILPARPRKPRDKAKVEQAVLIVERWLLGRLRHRTFYGLAEVNAAIADLMTHLNEVRPMRRLGVTRRELLEQIDRPALKSLPAEPYEFSEWKTCRVGIDYHVEVAAHYYSVPHRFARAEIEARLTVRTVEVFLKGERIAAHRRSSGNHKHTTIPEHMPSSHRRYAGWTIERIRADARRIGPATAALCELILESRPHPEQGFRACLGIVRLSGPYGAPRLEVAAERAFDIGARTYGSIKSILDNNLDRHPASKRATDATPILHSNIRGPRYYN